MRRSIPSSYAKINCRGYAGVPINPNTTSVSFIPRGEMDGQPKLKLLVNVHSPKILAEELLEIEVDLGLGGGFEARYYTCDFSYDYVTYFPSLRSRLF